MMFRRPGARVLARQERAPRWRTWAVRMALATALATGLAYFPYRLLDGSGARKAAELSRQHQRTVDTSRAVAEENLRLRSEIDALKNDVTAIEDIARTELGMVHRDEIIFRIEPAPAPPDGDQPRPEQRQQERP